MSQYVSGLSTPMLSAGLAEPFGFERGFRLDVAVILIWSASVGFSVYAGLAKGIRVLSDINLGLGAIVLAIVLLCGPTGFIIDTFTNSMGLLVQNFIRMSLYLDPVAKADGFIAALSEGASYVNAGATFPERWTIFYWAWWIAYAPFMGLFVARISRGRTIRELIATENRRRSAWMLGVLRGAGQRQPVLAVGRLAEPESTRGRRLGARGGHLDRCRGG